MSALFFRSRRLSGAFMALSSIGLLAMTPREAFAWGPYGHAIVADIAQSRLSPEATHSVQALLALEHYRTLDRVASWPDTIGHVPVAKGGLPQTLPWHYVDTDVAFSTYDKARDCADDICVTEKLPEMAHVLADRSAPEAKRLAALKWIVHLAGDLHQPLHAAERDHDKGGNAVKVSFFGDDRNGHENLHSLWDEGIMDRARHLVVGPHYTIDFARARAEAERLDAQITPGQAAYWSSGLTEDPGRGAVRDAVVTWTNESHGLARTVAYGLLPEGAGSDGAGSQGRELSLGETYSDRTLPVIETRLEQAGVRLAALLNRVFSKPGPVSGPTP
ncbi:S1/P1 nuclease [Swaminathania salitolerans]|uniref:Endonuclease n=2 Tax=Swaminathania salitolerans TaxID=182838 RepID=A0A511BXQ2_9PROT|nr:S1/P1 nuclease [Swaminathania salitolerans]GBQ12321.1 nuclease S1 [Swaminathania salitolerans LMG 21291]GEL02808.1 endonuclease [Swaminathania salitolerans]